VFLEVLKDPHLQEAAVNVMAKLFHDPEIVKSAMELVIAVVQKQETQKVLILYPFISIFILSILYFFRL
jgi:hypothetical protein